MNIHINNGISVVLLDKLTPKQSKLGSFRILPKLHKNKFGCRPIVNCRDHPTESLSKLIDLILQPFVKQTDSYVKDSQDVLLRTKDLFIDNESVLYSLDFESLYTNINTNKLLILISEFISPHLVNSKHINPYGFYEILKLILLNNIFQFDNRYFIQTSGVVMGSVCGPTLANLYIWILEKHWLHIYKPTFYCRFIDDILIINNKSIDIETFKLNFENLRLNFDCGISVHFLDLEISVDVITNKLRFRLYSKPTNTYSYLLQTSNHPTHIFKNVPKSLLIRIRRICTYYHDYLHFSQKLLFQLICRGYDYKNIKKLQIAIGRSNREEFINYKRKQDKYEDNFIFPFYFDKSITNFKQVISNCWNKYFLPEHQYYDATNIIAIPNLQSNLRNRLILNLKSQRLKSYSNKSCNSKFCKLCDLLLRTNVLNLNNNFKLPVMSYGNCDTRNVVYLIMCTKCNCYYIGQTGTTVKERINKHLSNIRKFLYFKQDTHEVSTHFGDNNHILENDFRFIILKDNLFDTKSRQSVESDIIHIFLSLKLNILNTFIPNMFFTSTLSFN